MVLTQIIKARRFPHYAKRDRLDAVVASTSPAYWMDEARAEAAVRAVRDCYGAVENYGGLWIAAGELGSQTYEESQRKAIVDTFIRNGVDKEGIVQIDGKDTVDKVRLLLELPSIEEGTIEYLGIASYHSHIARFNLALQAAQEQGFGQGVRIIGIPTEYLGRPQGDWLKRPIPDFVYGWTGLIKDSIRLKSRGFVGSLPEYESRLQKLAKKLNSESKD